MCYLINKINKMGYFYSMYFLLLNKTKGMELLYSLFISLNSYFNVFDEHFQ